MKTIKLTIREESMRWFNAMSLEERFYKTIKHNSLIAGDRTRHPNTLTGREIEVVYFADKNNKKPIRP